MKRTWQVVRRFQAVPDGLQRWARAYQAVLEWAMSAQPAANNEFLVFSGPTKETNHASRSLRPGFYATTSAKPKH
jgi:hypothetical protein